MTENSLLIFWGIYFGSLPRGPDLDSAVFVGSADEPVDADHHDDHEDAHQHHVQQVHLPTVTVRVVITMHSEAIWGSIKT